MHEKAVLASEIEPLETASLSTHIGGLPRGFDFSRWPVCKTCNRNQTFLLQLDLWCPVEFANKYRWVFVFACDDPGNCEPFLEDSGANAVIFATEQEALALAVVRAPREFEQGATRERHLSFQPFSDSEDDWIGSPEHFFGVAPNYHFGSVPECPHCGGEMNLIAQFEHAGQATYIAICDDECQDDAGYFMW